MIMLTYLKITNLALMESAEVEFHPGFNVVTGETGAGKSILLGTVALLLGVRADKSLIRQGSERCEIIGAIRLNDESLVEVEPLLEELSIALESRELRLRRVITHSGSRCYVNDTAVNLQTLAKFGTLMMDVYSANEQYTLLDHSRQLEMIDRYGKFTSEIAEYSKSFKAAKRLSAERDACLSNLPSPAEAELLSAVIRDIELVNPETDEDAKVGAQFSMVANGREILEKSAMACEILNEAEESICDRLSAVYRLISEINSLSGNQLEAELESCSAIREIVGELSGGIQRFADKTELDEESLANLEIRLSALQQLKRRHGPRLADVFLKLEESRQRVGAFQAADELRLRFDAEEKRLNAEIVRTGRTLSLLRQSVANNFASEIVVLLAKLGLPHARFEVKFVEQPPRENGLDEIDFFFSANKGMSPQSLRLMASSGELSRVMLAVKAVLANADTTPVLIFDEIDVNIGGETAGEVAKTIASLAKSRQVLCISHLAQVAARGEHHFMVCKNDNGATTSSKIVELSSAERVVELARMLGGGRAALLHAKELAKSDG